MCGWLSPPSPTYAAALTLLCLCVYSYSIHGSTPMAARHFALVFDISYALPLNALTPFTPVVLCCRSVVRTTSTNGFGYKPISRTHPLARAFDTAVLLKPDPVPANKRTMSTLALLTPAKIFSPDDEGTFRTLHAGRTTSHCPLLAHSRDTGTLISADPRYTPITCS